MSVRAFALIAPLAALLSIVAAACGGGSGPAATVQPSPTSDPRIEYYNKLGGLFQDYRAQAANADATSAVRGDSTPAPDVIGAPIGAGVALLEQLESALTSLTPTDAAKAAHQELLDATRDLITIGKRQQKSTEPANTATAEAEVVPAIQRFQKACGDLTGIAENDDAPIDLGCNPPD